MYILMFDKCRVGLFLPENKAAHRVACSFDECNVKDLGAPPQVPGAEAANKKGRARERLRGQVPPPLNLHIMFGQENDFTAAE